MTQRDESSSVKTLVEMWAEMFDEQNPERVTGDLELDLANRGIPVEQVVGIAHDWASKTRMPEPLLSNMSFYAGVILGSAWGARR